MATHMSKTLTTAKIMAKRYRKKGYESSVYKTKKGYGVSVTRK